MGLQITSYIEREDTSITANGETTVGNYIWLRIGQITYTISTEQAERLISELGKAVEQRNAK